VEAANIIPNLQFMHKEEDIVQIGQLNEEYRTNLGLESSIKLMVKELGLDFVKNCQFEIKWQPEDEEPLSEEEDEKKPEQKQE